MGRPLDLISEVPYTAFISPHMKEEMIELVAQQKGRLPPNQRAIDSILGWGTQHGGIVMRLPHVSKEEWSLTVDGEVENPTTFDWAGFMALPQVESISDFHCVEGWSVLDQRWEGVLFKDLSTTIKPKSTAKYAWFECYDTYTTSLPLERLMDDDVIITHRLNGEDLPQPLGGPVRMIVPKLYAYKSPMWLKKITFMTKDRLGYWESGYYSNTADPWKNDRYRRA